VIYCFDIDGTLCTNTHGAYEQSRPYPDAIARLNELYDAGHRIILFTARGSTTRIDWRELTERQLREWGVKYHEVLLGKPHADVYIDDRAINTEDWKARPLKDQGKAATPDNASVLKDRRYLEITYAPERIPYSGYPALLTRWLFEHVYGRPGRLLDLGVGRGEHLAGFQQLGFEVAGVDISPSAADFAKDYQVEVADLENEPLPFPASSFDFVFSKSVVEHLRNPARLLARALEALRPGGTAVIMTPSWVHTYWGPFYIDHTHVTPFTAPSLAEALSIVGFESVRVSHFYQLPFLWRRPFLKPLVKLVAALPLPYRPYGSAPWPDAVNKLIRFSKEVMLLGIARKPTKASG
jgi:SAM-dependent methyltransferase